MADYKFVLVDGSAAVGELSALNASMTLRLNEPSDLTLRLNALGRAAAEVRPFDVDILVYRDGVPLQRFVVGAVMDDVSASAHYLDVNAVDYRGRLDRRILLADTVAVDTSDVGLAWGLIDDAQNAPDGAMGLSLGAVPSGVNRSLTFLAGETVRGAIDRLANVAGGFEWDVTPGLEFVAFRGERGTNRGRILDYGGAVSEVLVASDPTLFHNAVRVVGDGTTVATVLTNVDPDVGRWDRETNLPTLGSQALVDATATRLLAQGQDEWVSYAVTLRDAPGVQAWGGLGDIDVGDTVRLVVRSGRLSVNEELRVQTLTVALDGNGAERITVEGGGRRRRVDDRQRQTERRVNDLELLSE